MDVDSIFEKWRWLDLVEVPDDIIEITGKVVPDGYKIQRDLAHFLEEATPWVLIEGTTARYDALAYLPHRLPIEEWDNGKAVVIPCNHVMKRYYCREQWDALEEEAKIQMHKVESLGDNRRDGIRARDDLSNETKEAILYRPRFLLGNTTYEHFDDLWREFKECCKCDPVDCPGYIKYVKSAKEWKAEQRFIYLNEGLHIFEVKSDKDTWERLAWQIPEMMEYADYIWLVIGEHMEIPQWIPPFIGILRYKDGRFFKERDTTGIKKAPGLYWHVLHEMGIREDKAKIMAVGMSKMHRFFQKWMVNSSFYFQGYQEERGNVVDMSHEVEWFNTMLLRMKDEEEKLLKMDARELRDLSKVQDDRNEIVFPRRQRTIESFFDESFSKELEG